MPERKKERRKKDKREGLKLRIAEEQGPASFSDPWEGHVMKMNMTQRFFGVPQQNSIVEDDLSVFTSKTDKACVREQIAAVKLFSCRSCTAC